MLPSALTGALSTASPAPAQAPADSLTAPFQEWESSYYLSVKALTSFLAPLWPTVMLHPNMYCFGPKTIKNTFMIHPTLLF